MNPKSDASPRLHIGKASMRTTMIRTAARVARLLTVLALISMFRPGLAMAVAECAYPPGDFQRAVRAVSEPATSESSTAMVVGTIKAVGPAEPSGYRRATVAVEIVFSGSTDQLLTVFYPAINDEDFAGQFLRPGSRYFLVARPDSFAGGLSTDECQATQKVTDSEVAELVAAAPSPLILTNAAPQPADADMQSAITGYLIVAALVAVIAISVLAVSARRKGAGPRS